MRENVSPGIGVTVYHSTVTPTYIFYGRNAYNAMPFIPAPLVSQVEMIFQYSGSTIEMVHHYKSDTAPTIAEWEALHVLLRADWLGACNAIMAPTLVWDITKFTDLTTISSPSYSTTTSLPLAGTSASAQLPNNCAMVVTKRTALRGRSYRGRSYVPGLTELHVTGNSILSGFTTPVINFFIGAQSYTVLGNVYNMVVLSRFTEGAPRIVGEATPVSNFTFDTTVDSQRRRLPGRGS